MSDWTSGYVADIGYTYGYYGELNPLRSVYPLIYAGWAPPELGVHCELGFGQGVSVNVHAAASTGTWYGTDFNPAQAAFAQSLSKASGANAHLYDEAFADFCHRADLPEFDSIGLHGIWSWISDDNRQVIVDFVRRKLKVGGVLYISYNTQPGWASFAPVRHLMTEHAESIGSVGQGVTGRVSGALDFVESLLAVNPAYLRANPGIAERFKQVKQQNKQYLAHEYFNRDWHPMPFSSLAKWLAPAKINFACSAHYADHVSQINHTPEQQVFLNNITDPLFKETVRDYIVNQQFRRDYWVKGPRRLSPLERAEALRQQRVVLAVPRDSVKLQVTGSMGVANMSEAIYNPLLDALADHKPQTLAQLEKQLADKNVALATLAEAVMLLSGTGNLLPVQSVELAQKARKATDRLNECLMAKARSAQDITTLVSPLTGGGVQLGRFQQLFLLARMQGKRTPEDWAQTVWQVLAAQGQRMVKDGKTLESPEDNVAELTTLAREFQDRWIPIFKTLMIAT